LQSDNDRLKKASAFFAMEMNNDINALGVVAIHAVENPKSGEY
jgi:hypothetical protein